MKKFLLGLALLSMASLTLTGCLSQEDPADESAEEMMEGEVVEPEVMEEDAMEEEAAEEDAMADEAAEEEVMEEEAAE